MYVQYNLFNCTYNNNCFIIRTMKRFIVRAIRICIIRTIMFFNVRTIKVFYCTCNKNVVILRIMKSFHWTCNTHFFNCTWTKFLIVRTMKSFYCTYKCLIVRAMKKSSSFAPFTIHQIFNPMVWTDFDQSNFRSNFCEMTRL